MVFAIVELLAEISGFVFVSVIIIFAVIEGFLTAFVFAEIFVSFADAFRVVKSVHQRNAACVFVFFAFVSIIELSAVIESDFAFETIDDFVSIAVFNEGFCIAGGIFFVVL